VRRTVAPDDVLQLVATARSLAFKFEQLDSYLVDVDDDVEVFERWLRGEADPTEGLDDWLDLMRELTSSGRAVRRARVVTLPPTDYVRFEAAAVPASHAAGEEIHYMSRADAAGLPEHDFWLLDDDRVLIMHFDDTGMPTAHDLTDNPAEVARHQAWADLAWQRATPYDAFSHHFK